MDSNQQMILTRRSFNGSLFAAALAAMPIANAAAIGRHTLPDSFAHGNKNFAHGNKNEAWKPRYLLASCLYGYERLAKILPEVAKTGATAIDIWPKVHGNQREQLDQMGVEKFKALLKKHDVTLGCITQYKLGPFGLKKEMQLARQLGCKTIVTGARGPRGQKGRELKKAVADFIEKLKPHLEVATETGVTIAIENHASSLIESPDSMKYLAELRPSKNLAIAFAPYHLQQDSKLLAELIAATGEAIEVFYAWQHGKGCMKKMPKADELLQMPGRGKLDFAPLLKALAKVKFAGWTEIFMHPYPRGKPILDSAEKVTGEINRARDYLQSYISSPQKGNGRKPAKN